jgi:hypothetical protein
MMPTRSNHQGRRASGSRAREDRGRPGAAYQRPTKAEEAAENRVTGTEGGTFQNTK